MLYARLNSARDKAICGQCNGPLAFIETVAALPTHVLTGEWRSARRWNVGSLLETEFKHDPRGQRSLARVWQCQASRSGSVPHGEWETDDRVPLSTGLSRGIGKRR